METSNALNVKCDLMPTKKTCWRLRDYVARHSYILFSQQLSTSKIRVAFKTHLCLRQKPSKEAKFVDLQLS